MTEKPQIKISYVATDLQVNDLEINLWDTADVAGVNRYWNGHAAPVGRHFTARLLWSNTAIYIRFEANQAELPIIVETPDTSQKAMNLWDRDVVEIFLAPDQNEPRKYFEFEAAPTGEWLDVALDSTSGTRVSDWEFASGMETASKIEERSVTTVIKVPWSAFGKRPEPGDVWLGNLLRCVGQDPSRGYLAWSPTMTEEPNFHVPERFGEFHFVK